MSGMEETAHAAQGGDAAAFETLFAQNLPRLVAFIRARAGGVVAAKESAYDLAQSVCREALEDIDRFEFRGDEAFRHWLFVRATRKIMNRHRWHHREKRDPGREVQPAMSDSEAHGIVTAYATLSSPSRVAGAREELARIEGALGRLAEPQRDAIALTRVAGFSYQEAAEQMGKTESAVRGLVMRGLARLSGLLEEGES